MTVTDSKGCTDSDDITVTVHPLPTVDAGADVTIIESESVVIGGAPTATGNGPFTYDWTPSTGLDDASLANPTASPVTTTTYTVEVTDANGCVATDSVEVTVRSPDEAIDDLEDLVDSMGLHGGTTNSLTSKLQNAKQSLMNGQANAALNLLQAFINQVNAQRGKKLTDAQADELIAEAQRIIDAINATSPP